MNNRVIRYFSRLLVLLVFLGAVLFVLPQSVSALNTTYYVDNTCVNNGNGTSQTCAAGAGQAGPFNSIANTQAKAGGYSAGDSILLKKGLTFAERFTFSWSGSSEGVITIGAYGTGANPKLNPALTYPLYLNGSDYVTVDGVDVETAVAGSVAIRQRNGNDHITLTNLVASGVAYAMYSQDTTTNQIISHSTFIATASPFLGIYFFGTNNQNITIIDVTLQGGTVIIGSTENINISDIVAANTGTALENGNEVISIGTGTGVLDIRDITASEGYGGVIGVASSNYTEDNAAITDVSIINSTPMGAAGVDIRDSSYIDLSDVLVDGLSTGIKIYGTSHHIDITDSISRNNFTDGVVTTDTAHDITCLRCVSNNNGTKSELPTQGTGDGFTTHMTNYNINFYYSLSYNNTNTGFALWANSSGNVYNCTAYNNGGDWTADGGGPTSRGGFAAPLAVNPTSGTTFFLKNSIFVENYPTEIYATDYWLSAGVANYNIYSPTSNSNFFSDSNSGGIKQSWDTYHTTNGYEANSQNADPLFVNPGVNFYLQELSPAIDSGLDVGLTTDFEGNNIYGTPDIGAYEYQPPFTVGTNELDIAGDVRIYADGQFRNTQTTSGTTADLSVTPVGGFGSGDYSEWMDIDISAWNTSGTYKKTWTEESALIGTTSTLHTVGDLRANQKYMVKVNNALSSSITGTNCSGSVCTANGSGEITFTYSGGYSTVTFDVEEDSTAPASFSIISPSGITRDNTKPTLSFKKSSDTNGITSYTVTLDSGKNKSYSVTGIPANGSGTASNIWRDDSDVRVEFINENDSDSSNDEIRVYFKGLDSNELTEGKHTWTVTAYDSANNSTSQTTDFYLDRTSPSISELAIADVFIVNSGVTYNLSITNRTPSFSGLATDIYQGSTVTNSNGTKDTFDKVSSGPKNITLTIKKLKDGQDSTSQDAVYEDYLSKEFSLSDITNLADDKKFTRFFVTTPFPLVDGYYKIQLTLKDEAGNTQDYSVFYISLNNQATTPASTIKNLFSGTLETELTNQETTPTETEEEKKQVAEQGYTVKVKVVDDQNNPVKDAKVTIHSKVQETTSDENGIATFINVEPGDHKILIAYDGYEGEQKVTLTGDVKEFSFNVTVRKQNPFVTPQVIALVGGLVLLVIVLVVLLLKSKSRKA